MATKSHYIKRKTPLLLTEFKDAEKEFSLCKNEALSYRENLRIKKIEVSLQQEKYERNEVLLKNTSLNYQRLCGMKTSPN